MDISEYMKIDSDWLKKDDVTYKGMNVIITTITEELVGQEKERKLALHFRGDTKAMLLNKVNLRILVAMFGTDTKAWLGESVNVYNDPTVTYNGATGGLRLRPPTAERQPAPDIAERYAAAAQADHRSQQQQPPAGRFDDDIPF